MPPPATTPLASLSLDLDNQWSYMKVHGDAGWDSYPTYLPVFIPYILDLLGKLDLRITFFIVGRDAEAPENAEFLQQLAEHGHDIGNHSYAHESWLKTYSAQAIADEVRRAEELVRHATGRQPCGFRGPGFSWSHRMLQVLADRGYLYDASTLPTYIGPLARQYYFMTARLTAAEKKLRQELFGSFADGFRPVAPYYWDLGSGQRLLEIPVTTMPVFKTPFHLSYLLYLSGYSLLLMRLYLRLALTLCRLQGITPSFLLHPLDLISGEQIPALRFFPGMDIPAAKKQLVFTSVIGMLQQHFTLVPMRDHAQSLIDSQRIATVACRSSS